jgi:hypothetical protein
MTRWTCSFTLCVALVMLLPRLVSAQAIAGLVTAMRVISNSVVTTVERPDVSGTRG